MKIVVVLLATAAIAAASVIDRRILDAMDDCIITIHGDTGKQVKICKQNGLLGENNIEIEVTRPNSLTEGYYDYVSRDDIGRGRVLDEVLRKFKKVNDYHLGFDDATVWDTTTFGKTDRLGSLMYPRWTENMRGLSWLQDDQGFDSQFDQKVQIKLLLKMFEEQALMQMLNQYGQDQSFNEMVLGNILSTRGIFDKEVLIELMKDSYLRDSMITHKIFHRSIVEQILNKQKTLHDLEQIINRQVLKHLMVRVGCCDRFTLRKLVNENIFENVVDTDTMGRKWLFQVLKDNTLRKFLVQQGIFNTDILEKLMFVADTKIQREDLLMQLINRRVLKNQLIHQGFFENNMLNRMVNDEVLGLKVLLKKHVLQHTVPFDDDLVGITTKRNILDMDDLILDTDRDRMTTKYGLWNMLGQQDNVLRRLRTLGHSNDFRRRQILSNQMTDVVDLM